MKTKGYRLLFGALLLCLASVGMAEAATVTGEEALFTTSTAPDAMIVLDLSGSMAWNPPGDDLTYGSTETCTADAANCTGTGCSGGFCSSSKSSVTYYAGTTCGVADATNCVGSNCANGFCTSSKGATTVYAAAACGTADFANCRGTTCGRTDGFCNSDVAGGVAYYAHASCSVPDTDNCRYTESWKDCANGFCASSHHSRSRSCEVACTTSGCSTACTTGSCAVQCTSGGCTKACSRLAIAKRSIANILDDNNDGTINATDETSLGVRLGYMRFYNCGDDDTGGSYTSGCNSLIKTINSSYSSINTAVQAESALGGTPIASALNEAKLYLDVHKAADTAKSCRQKFVILITDGSDTYACSGDGSECDPERYKNRRAVVARAKALGDAGYKVFVIGFGTAMPPYLKNTLNWMAYYGGTDNPNSPNTGSPTGYSIVTGCSATNTSACCSDTNTTACYPTGVTDCMDSSSVTETCYDAAKPYPGTAGNSTSNFKASANDPGYLDLSGYAFLASNADDLVAAVKAAINIIREATYSFSQSSIQSNRTIDENYIYEGSFQPISGDPFWFGHLKKYSVNDDGTVGTSQWDAGELLRDKAAADRVIYTHKSTSTASPYLTAFTTANITATDLAVASDAARDAVVGYIRGESAYNADNWKLGDVFRSAPITVGTPSAFFDDARDSSSPTGFSDHRSNHVRTSADASSGRIILAGANDGQLHAFLTGSGAEVWSFIPPNLLSRLRLIAHATEPSLLSHLYFVDGPVTVGDAWIPETDSAGTSKSAADWHTFLVFGEGRGATNLWSSSSSCDSGFNAQYSSTYQYYCGYYGLDLTSTLSPVYKWRLNFSAARAPYMGAPWSKAMIGRVRIGGNEKWVAFVGGGAYAPNATHSGKGLFVVDLRTGEVLWSYTRADNTDLDSPMPAAPAVVDTDNDGFVDRVYIGDIGSNMWRFKLCASDADSTCGTSNWTGGRLYAATSSAGIRPIYTLASVAKDFTGTLWVYWGTGDKTDPTAANAQEKIFAVKDTDGTSTRTVADLENITSVDKYTDSSAYGFYINLTGQGEKMLADPTVFGGVLYITTFTPSNSNNPCEQGGAATLYGINAMTGAGTLTTSTSTTPSRTLSIGTGIASAPVISFKPGSSGSPDLYVTTSGGGLIGAQTKRVNMNPPGVVNRTNLLFWKDKRLE